MTASCSYSSDSRGSSASSCTNSSTAENNNNHNISSAAALARQWAAPKLVTLIRDPDHGLGISIVGGKLDLLNLSTGSGIAGIFIKNVLPESPAGRSGLLKRGDRILEVCDIDVRGATHEEAVAAIKNAHQPITFLVQSLLSFVSSNSLFDSSLGSPITEAESNAALGIKPPRRPTSQPPLPDEESDLFSDDIQLERSSSATLAAIPSVITDDSTMKATESDDEITCIEESSSAPLTASEGTPLPHIEPLPRAQLRSISNSSERPHILVPVAPWPMARTPSPELIQSGTDDIDKQDFQARIEAFRKKERNEHPLPPPPLAPPPPTRITLRAKLSSSSTASASTTTNGSDEDDESELSDDRDTQGKVVNKHGTEVGAIVLLLFFCCLPN